MKNQYLIGLFAFLLVGLLTAFVIFKLQPASILPTSKAPSPTSIPPTALTPSPILEAGITLEIGEPKSGAAFATANITVKGKTVKNADVFVNSKELKADANGNFSTGIILDEGENTIVVGASDEAGNYVEKELVVSYEPNE